MQKTESQILAEVLNQTRNIGKYYMGRLKTVDPLKEFEVDGKKFNCVQWVMSHIVWAEYMLILQSLNGPQPDIPWLQKFDQGSNSSPQPDWPSLPEVYTTMQEVHDVAMSFLSALDDKILDEPYYLKVSDWHTDKRHAIMHAIRHEGMHIGHLSWLCKLHGIKGF